MRASEILHELDLTQGTASSIETVASRIARLGLEGLSDGRQQSLAMAHDLGADDSTLVLIANATLVARGSSTIVLPAHRFESLSRGRGWARSGAGNNARWGERTDNGYSVGPGRWTVGGNDGFSRKGAADWKVCHLAVGSQTWTTAS